MNKSVLFAAESYVTPLCETLAVEEESILCGSPDSYSDWGNAGAPGTIGEGGNYDLE